MGENLGPRFGHAEVTEGPRRLAPALAVFLAPEDLQDSPLQVVASGRRRRKEKARVQRASAFPRPARGRDGSDRGAWRSPCGRCRGSPLRERDKRSTIFMTSRARTKSASSGTAAGAAACETVAPGGGRLGGGRRLASAAEQGEEEQGAEGPLGVAGHGTSGSSVEDSPILRMQRGEHNAAGIWIPWRSEGRLDLVDVVGRQIGTYRIEAELGRGAMGVVFRARSASGVDVALKCLLHGASTPPSDEAARRFSDELAAARALRSPHVVPVLDGGRDAALGPWIAFELQRGRDSGRGLDHRSPRAGGARGTGAPPSRRRPGGPSWRRHRPSGPEAREPLLLRGRCPPHRRSRPRPIRVGREARTATGTVVGTPGYVAPERFDGAACMDDPRIDVYSMAALSVACLTGDPPFPGAGSGPDPDPSAPPGSLARRGWWRGAFPGRWPRGSPGISPWMPTLRDGSAFAFLETMEHAVRRESDRVAVSPTLVLKKASGEVVRDGGESSGRGSSRAFGFAVFVLVVMAVAFLVFRERAPRGASRGRFQGGRPSGSTVSEAAKRNVVPELPVHLEALVDRLSEAGEDAPRILRKIWGALSSNDGQDGLAAVPFRLGRPRPCPSGSENGAGTNPRGSPSVCSPWPILGRRLWTGHLTMDVSGRIWRRASTCSCRRGGCPVPSPFASPGRPVASLRSLRGRPEISTRRGGGSWRSLSGRMRRSVLFGRSCATWGDSSSR